MVYRLALGVILILLLTPVFFLNAQVLGDTDIFDSTTVTVGTTTYDVEFLPPPFLGGAEATIQNILFYLRNGFGFENSYAPAPIVPVIPEVQETNVYNDIADIAFSTEPVAQGVGAAGNILGGSCQTFVGSYEIGDSHPEILEIQRFLNKDPDTRVASSGAGSPGEETDFFGVLTLNAVNAFQRKYATEILNPIGLFQPSGFWGAASRAKANELYGCK